MIFFTFLLKYVNISLHILFALIIAKYFLDIESFNLIIQLKDIFDYFLKHFLIFIFI